MRRLIWRSAPARLLQRSKVRFTGIQGRTMLSKLDLVLIAASLAAVVGSIERGHNVVIGPPEAVEFALVPAGACLDDVDETVRLSYYDEGFLGGPLPPAHRRGPTCGGD